MNQPSRTTSHVKGRRYDDVRTVSLIRAMLLTIFILGSVGSGAELLLLNHIESLLQWIPLVLIMLSFLVLGWHAVRRTPASTRAIQGSDGRIHRGWPCGVLFPLSGQRGVQIRIESILGRLAVVLGGYSRQSTACACAWRHDTIGAHWTSVHLSAPRVFGLRQTLN